MKPAPVAPPHLVARCLSAAVGSAPAAETILGDLHEEFHALASRRGPWTQARARAWYCRQALAVGTRYAFQRARRRLSRPDAPPAPRLQQGDSLMRTTFLDLRHAVRTLTRRPAASIVIVGTLALGLGANAAIFGVVDALVLRPYSFAELDRITMLSETAPEDLIGARERVAPANYLDWRAAADSFDAMAAFEWWDANLTASGNPERVAGFQVSAEFFTVLGVQASIGRTFLPGEDTLGQHRRAVISHALWQRRFGGDASVVGRSIHVDGESFDVVGIAPRGFDFPMGAEIWAPLAMTAKTAARRDARYLTVLGRLAPGRSIDDAQAEMAVIATRLEREHPDENKHRGARVLTLVGGMKDEGLGPMLLLWQSSAVFVLLIACANIANLLLARGAERQRDLAVRLALGASRARLVRQMLIESAVLAAAAIPAALAVSALGLHLMRVSMPPRIMRFVAGWQNMDVDIRLFAFTAALAAAAAFVFGIVPALQASRPRVAEALKDGGRSASSGRSRLRRTLVVAEIALALPLLVAAALSVAGANRFLNGPQGYDPERVLILRAVLPDAQYAEPAARHRFVADVLERLQSVPGIESAAAVNIIPSGSANSGRTLEIDGRPHADPANPPRVDYRVATPSYFDTMRVPIKAGRGLTAADRDTTQQVAVISETMAAQYWPEGSPLGQRLRLGDGPWLTVVGVAGDVMHDWFARRAFPTVYRPFEQAPAASLVVAVRTVARPEDLVMPAIEAIRAVDPVQPVFDVMSMRRLLHERTIGLQYVAGIMAVFGGLALILAIVGVYSVMAFLVTQRTHEIGVRVALGANRQDVLRLTIGQTSRLTAIGVSVGLALSLLLGRLLESSLFGAISNDLRLQAALTVVLVIAALAAGYFPARKAARIDPVIALRAH